MSKNISSSKQKRLTGSSSSSFCGSSSSIAELFEAPSSPPSDSSSIFRTVFGPPSMGRGRNSTTHLGNLKHASPGNREQSNKGENSKSSYYQEETIEQPCYYSSSILYGGQEVYFPSTRPSEPHLTFMKDEQDDDPNSASRGNWWKGSLYY